MERVARVAVLPMKAAIVRWTIWGREGRGEEMEVDGVRGEEMEVGGVRGDRYQTHIKYDETVDSNQNDGGKSNLHREGGREGGGREGGREGGRREGVRGVW